MKCVVCPGNCTVITPAHMQFRIDVLLSAGKFLSRTVGEPGTHGAGVAGMQGCGVSTPRAAAVAAATWGLAGLMHMPKGMMFFIEMWSMMFAAGWKLVFTIFSGVTTKTLGVMPIVHPSNAPLQTCSGISRSPHVEVSKVHSV